MAAPVRFTSPRVIHSRDEYDAAVAEAERLLARDPRPGTRAYDRLELLTVLIEKYDDEHFPMGATSTPQSVVAFMLEQSGMTRSDLAPLLGGPSRVSEFFSGKRPLSVQQIIALRDQFGIPADALIGRRDPRAASRRRESRPTAARGPKHRPRGSGPASTP